MLQGWLIFQELAAPLAAVCALGAALGAAWAAFLATRAVRTAGADAHLRIFLKFSDEYEKLKVGLPVMGGKNPEQVYLVAMGQPKYQVAVFNLCRLFEREHHLNRRGLVPQNIWQIWETEMRALLALKPVKDFVLKNREQFRQGFVEEMVEK